jgi:tRNA pseudouridine38/39 synthase
MLHVAYTGWDYSGFVVQEHTQKTIEAELFRALEKTRLVENRETSNYHRCGRTDKGVSSFGQVQLILFFLHISFSNFLIYNIVSFI